MGSTAGRVAALVLAVLAALTGCGQGTDREAAPSAQRPMGAPVASSPARSASPPSSPARPASPPSSPRVDPVSGWPEVAESALPPQARRTLALIRAGGPYPYPRNDDQTFGNREGRLPPAPVTYYTEYTVATPGQADRGPRRIVAGRGGERYYTEDHYETFRRIREGA